MNAFTPARGGELAKVLIARTRIQGSTVPTLAASLTVVLVADGLIGGLLVCGLWATGVLPVLPSPPGPLALELAAAGVAVAAAASDWPTACGPSRCDVSRAVRRRVCASPRQPARYACTVLPFQIAHGVPDRSRLARPLGLRHPCERRDRRPVVVLNGASTLVPVPGGAGTQQVLAAYALQGASPRRRRCRSRSACRSASRRST